jgi:hypothetical protein
MAVANDPDSGLGVMDRELTLGQDHESAAYGDGHATQSRK